MTTKLGVELPWLRSALLACCL